MKTPHSLLLMVGLISLLAPQVAGAKSEKKSDEPAPPVIPATLSSETEPADFYGVTWGMTREEVQAVQDAKPKTIQNVDGTWIDRVAGKPCTLNFIFEEDKLVGMEAFYDRFQPEQTTEGVSQGERVLADFDSMASTLSADYGTPDGPVYLREDGTLAPPSKDPAGDILKCFTIRNATWAMPNSVVALDLYPTSLITHQLKKNFWTGVQKERKITKELGLRVTLATRDYYPVIVSVRRMDKGDRKANKGKVNPEIGRGEQAPGGKIMN